MDHFLSTYENPEVKNFNEDIIRNLREEPLVPYIVETFRHLETTPYIKFIDYTHITDYVEMDLSKIDRRHVKGKSNDYVMDIEESYLSKLIIRLQINYKGKTGIKEIPLLLPEKLNIYYYYLNGKKYYPIYQLVDNSTYTNKGNLILKTMLLPLIVSRKKMPETDAYVFKYNLFSHNPAKNPTNLLSFFFAEFACTKTLKYFNMEDIIRVVHKKDMVKYIDGNEVIVPIKNSIVLIVDKAFYEKSEVVKNLTHTLEDLIQNTTHVNMSVLNDKEFWVKALGSKFLAGNKNKKNKYYSKGTNILISFKRLLDNLTKEHIKVNEFNKKDVFAVSRWMVTNFNALRHKSSLDLVNKRLRLNEYIASYLAVELSKKINRLLSASANTLSFEYIEDTFNMRQNILIDTLRSSPLLQYEDTVNDMNILSSLKYSSKGPSSIGGSNSRNVNMKYKALHHSHLGRIDICTGSASSIGITGMLTPFIKMDGFFFDEGKECQSSQYDLFKLKKEINELRGTENFIKLKIDSEEDYYEILDQLDIFKDNFKVKVKNKILTVSAVDDKPSKKLNIKIK